MKTRWLITALLSLGGMPTAHAADATKLYGIHWWGFTADQNGNLTQPLDIAPRDMLDAGPGGQSAWDTETAITHSDWWWSAQNMTGAYAQIRAWNVTPLTRIDYTWNDTVPAPADPNYAGWPVAVRNAVNVLTPWTRFWIIGNEPNLLMAPGSLWPNRQIPPADYATIYRNVRNEIRASANASPEGSHIVLVAGPSPGPLVPGVRWMVGTDYLDQVLANIPASEVDGIAIHAYAGDLNSFRNDYQSQLQVIDNRGLGSQPVWITEFNRWTDTNNCNDEATSAQFVRDSFADINAWNNTAGNHNIVGMTWFIYDANQQAGGGWNNYAIEYWKGVCLTGAADLYQAFAETVDLRYNAGAWGGGGPPPPPPPPPGGTNLALNAVTYLECGHNNADQYGLAAHDGLTATKWCCLHNGIWTAGDHWLSYDLGSSASVTGYVIKHASTGGESVDLNTDQFSIESAASLQGPWTQEFSVNNACSKVSSNTLTYGTPKALRFVRIRVTKPTCASDWAVRIPEVEVWGTAGTLAAVKFEAEDYDAGYVAAEGVDYHDLDAGNTGGQYRSQNVDIEICSEGGYNVGWISSTEWLKYRLKTSGTFQIYVRYAGTATGTCHLEVDGLDVTGAITLPATGSWQTWATKTGPQVTLGSGNHIVKLVLDSSGFNVNYFTFDPALAQQPVNLALTAATYNECGHNNADQYGSAARDGSTSTKWCCLHNGAWTAGDHWLAYDLGSTATVTKYVIKHASTGGETVDFNTDQFFIESAPALTQTTWTQEFSVNNACSKVASNTLTYGTPKALRFVRIRVTKPNCSADWVVRIPEVEVWGTAGTLAVVRLQAEDYDSGFTAAEGADYHDTTAGNSGGQYRSQNVDIENCSEGGYNVGWTSSTEWLDFPVYGGGVYTLNARVAAVSTGKAFHVEIDGVNVSGTITVPQTGGWQTWTTTSKTLNSFATGNHTLRLVADTDGFNWNWVELAP